MLLSKDATFCTTGISRFLRGWTANIGGQVALHVELTASIVNTVKALNPSMSH